MRCDVWWARPAAATPRLLAMLDDVERERYAGYRREIDKLRFLTGRTLIRAIAGTRLGVEPEAVVLDSSCYACGKPHGKPTIVAAGAPAVSISHSGERVALAVVDGPPVGIDVEEIRDAKVDDLAGIAFSAIERDEFAAVPRPAHRAAFFTYWARKEAVLKATGKGMSIPMNTFTLSAFDAAPRILSSDSTEVDPARVHLADVDAGAAYRATVAIIGDPPPTGWVVEQDADALIADLG